MGEGRSGSTCLRCYRLYRNAALPYPVLPCEIISRTKTVYGLAAPTVGHIPTHSLILKYFDFVSGVKQSFGEINLGAFL